MIGFHTHEASRHHSCSCRCDLDIRFLLSPAADLGTVVARGFWRFHARRFVVRYVLDRPDTRSVAHTQGHRLSIHHRGCRVSGRPLAGWLDREAPSLGVCWRCGSRAVCFSRSIPRRSVVGAQIQEDTCNYTQRHLALRCSESGSGPSPELRTPSLSPRP